MKVVVVGVLAESIITFRGEMIRAMVARGHQVLAIAPEDDHFVRAALRQMGADYQPVAFRRTGMNPARDLDATRNLVRVLRVFRPDAILVYAAKPVIFGSMAARIAGVPHRSAMITGVGSALAGGSTLGRKVLSRLMAALYAVGLRQTHVVFFQNPDDERLFRQRRLISSRQRVVRINGSGVDLDHFAAAPFPPDPVTFLMIGRLLRDKGVTEYVEAARQIRAERPDARFQLLGPLDSNPTAVSEAELKAWADEGVIDYLGSTTDVRPYLAAAHVFVLPSYGEGMPRSVLEAMALGRAVLTTDVPGCRETVVPGRNGYLVAPRDGAALAAGLRRMLDEAGRLEQMGRESRAIAEERFDVHQVNRVILGAIGLDGQVTG
jgi:glycosyltransferase involved in cell wall biosynthesis